MTKDKTTLKKKKNVDGIKTQNKAAVIVIANGVFKEVRQMDHCNRIEARNILTYM